MNDSQFRDEVEMLLTTGSGCLSREEVRARLNALLAQAEGFRRIGVLTFDGLHRVDATRFADDVVRIVGEQAEKGA